MFGYSSRWSLGQITLRWDIKFGYCQQGFGVGAARSRGIWLEPEPLLWPCSGSSFNFSLNLFHANCIPVFHNLYWCIFSSGVKNKIGTTVLLIIQVVPVQVILDKPEPTVGKKILGAAADLFWNPAVARETLHLPTVWRFHSNIRLSGRSH